MRFVVLTRVAPDLLDIAHDRIIRMQRAGLIEHWRQEFWPRPDRCSETATGGNDGSGIQAISVSDMQGSFYLLAIGDRARPLFNGKRPSLSKNVECDFQVVAWPACIG